MSGNYIMLVHDRGVRVQLSMVFTTRGMVLTRQRYREFDENILFYTEGLGKIRVFSFGSQSPRSFRGQRLAEWGWLNLEIEKKGSRYLLKEVEQPYPIPEYQKKKQYFLGWTEFLQRFEKKIPGSTPTPELFSLLYFLSGPEPSRWHHSFREFTWYFSALVELGIFPNFSSCCRCRQYCSDGYLFFLPGEVIGTACIAEARSLYRDHRDEGLPDRLALEDVYFLNYCRQNYNANPDFFEKIFVLEKKLFENRSSLNTPSSLPSEEGLIQEREFSIHWDRILPVLKRTLVY